MKKFNKNFGLIFPLMVFFLWGCSTDDKEEVQLSSCNREGGAFLKAELDGEDFCSFFAAAVHYDLEEPIGSYFMISGTSQELGSIFVVVPDKEGTYELGISSTGGGYTPSLTEHLGYAADEAYGDEATITVSEISDTHLKGSFEFTASEIGFEEGTAPKKVNITNGQFEVAIPEETITF